MDRTFCNVQTHRYVIRENLMKRGTLMDDYILECDLARAICIGDEKNWPSYMEEARSIIASVRKAGYEITRSRRRNSSRKLADSLNT